MGAATWGRGVTGSEGDTDLDAALDEVAGEEDLEQAFGEILQEVEEEQEAEEEAAREAKPGPGGAPGGAHGEAMGPPPPEYLEAMSEGMAWGWEECWRWIASVHGVEEIPPDVLRADEVGERAAPLVDTILQRWMPLLMQKAGPELMLATALTAPSFRIYRWIRNEARRQEEEEDQPDEREPAEDTAGEEPLATEEPEPPDYEEGTMPDSEGGW